LLGETITQSVKRIAQEELGVNVEALKLLDYIEYPSETRARGYGQSIGLAMLTVVKSSKLPKTKNGEEVSEFKTFPKKIIPEQKVFLEKTFKFR
jgi:ADP-ribose pyrophosphatase YjhB (NUDIX family)